MGKLGIKIPLLMFFLAVVYFSSNGSDVIDAVIRAFIFAFGIALIFLVLTMMLVFFITVQNDRAVAPRISVAKETGKKVEVQA